ncbi:hypothetical protein TNCV_1054701 [Trichonephila clavipes]|nr:hypothetical protein TNCV_1054701 [Trichonephila clavipes]
MEVARAWDRLDFFTIDGDTTDIHSHNLGKYSPTPCTPEREICINAGSAIILGSSVGNELTGKFSLSVVASDNALLMM